MKEIAMKKRTTGIFKKEAIVLIVIFLLLLVGGLFMALIVPYLLKILKPW